MSINLGEMITTNFNELEEEKDYFIKFWLSNGTYYNGIYTYIGHPFHKFIFTNLTYNIEINPIEYTAYSTRQVYFIGEVIKLDSNVTISQQTCDIFEILTNEYVLK
jgi:hypothetical protein